MSVDCPECGESFDLIGQHWVFNEDHRPSLTQQQREIVTGLLMGDGSLDRGNKNPRLYVCMISPSYLKHLDKQFGILGTGVSLKMAAAESAKEKIERGFSQSVDPENYSDVYHWNTRCHPELHEFNWYGSGEKVWPNDITLTPTVLKHWFCGDGNWNNSGSNNHIRIGMSNEAENTDKVDSYFERADLPLPSNYDIYKYDDGRVDCNAEFTVDASTELWDYMGEPLPDFEYKWPKDFSR